ncbi:RNA pyrophosphohydrolase [Microvirga puerhi]|uniref:RNA pyrophosphohydrolase n=1 Tax=Microvirga puerhi TaxID=2876078 RepID=A0ABS7VR87_9HYPH|nr:RNA pyrophosphohydrolase [Microvirga puerhi]MBZ6078044.1 RNA pyrophosphohydrolase [Microvirga puerhi]
MSALPNRHNVGIALFNQKGLVLIARRLRDDGPEIITPGHEWQMPQGGVDPHEETQAAALRELWEETSVRSVSVLACMYPAMTYDFPSYSGPPHKLAAFSGQRQIWYAMRFLGDESEIDVTVGQNGEAAEFDIWRWAPLSETVDLVVPFKRAIYSAVNDAFACFAQPAV